jgi:type IV fimbrial biogenesis protein FimT
MLSEYKNIKYIYKTIKLFYSYQKYYSSITKKIKLFQYHRIIICIGTLHASFKHEGDLRMAKNSNGFTLTELMIVVAIIGIMALITAPNLVTGLPTYRIKSATRDCTSKLRGARSQAIKEKRNVIISFTDDNTIMIGDNEFPPSGSFQEEYGSGVSFGSGEATTGIDGESMPSDAISFNENSLTFTTRGLADFGAGTMNGAVYFTNNRGDSYAVTVNAAGAVSLLRWRDSGWSR